MTGFYFVGGETDREITRYLLSQDNKSNPERFLAQVTALSIASSNPDKNVAKKNLEDIMETIKKQNNTNKEQSNKNNEQIPRYTGIMF